MLSKTRCTSQLKDVSLLRGFPHVRLGRLCTFLWEGLVGVPTQRQPQRLLLGPHLSLTNASRSSPGAFNSTEHKVTQGLL